MDLKNKVRDSSLTGRTKSVLMRELGNDVTLLDVHGTPARRLLGISGLGRVRLKELIEAGIVEGSVVQALRPYDMTAPRWKSISSAPTDGSAILVATKKFPIVTISWWDGTKWADPCQTGTLGDVGYWLPLPSPPLH